MRTIIAGSRDRIYYRDVVKAIEESGFDITTVVSGRCRGTDMLGEHWAKIHGVPVDPYPAKWKVNGILDRGAGLKRNVMMAENAEALVAVWDGASDGTRHMIRVATDKGLKVYVHVVDNL